MGTKRRCYFSGTRSAHNRVMCTRVPKCTCTRVCVELQQDTRAYRHNWQIDTQIRAKLYERTRIHIFFYPLFFPSSPLPLRGNLSCVYFTLCRDFRVRGAELAPRFPFQPRCFLINNACVNRNRDVYWENWMHNEISRGGKLIDVLIYIFYIYIVKLIINIGLRDKQSLNVVLLINFCFF